MANYELTFRMQTAAMDLIRIDHEAAATRELHGVDKEPTARFWRMCLPARRSADRGVRQRWPGHRLYRRTGYSCCKKIHLHDLHHPMLALPGFEHTDAVEKHPQRPWNISMTECARINASSPLRTSNSHRRGLVGSASWLRSSPCSRPWISESLQVSSRPQPSSSGFS